MKEEKLTVKCDQNVENGRHLWRCGSVKKMWEFNKVKYSSIMFAQSIKILEDNDRY